MKGEQLPLPGTPPPLDRRCIIVAGVHRSGTSAVTRIINLLGADIARELMPAAPANNESGFWESSAVERIHEQLLHALGSAWHDPLPLPDDWLKAEATQQAKRRLADEITKDFTDSALFVVKDPRITRLLPMWLEILDELAIEPIVVMPVRNPLEIAASLQARDRFPVAKSLLLYARGYLETELESRGRRRFFVGYEQLLDDWRPFATRLEAVSGSHLAAHSAERAAEIDDFLTAELRHYRYSHADLTQTRDIAATVVEMFDRMSDAADRGDETELRPAFDRLRQTLVEATRLYGGLIAAERATARAEIIHLREDREAVKAHADAENATRHGEMGRLRTELESAHRQVAEATQLRLGLESKAVELTAELAAARDQAARSERALEARSIELASERAQVVGLQGAAAAQSAQAAQLGTALAAALQRVERAETAATELRHTLDAITRSTAWRLTRPIRLIVPQLPRRIRQVIKVIGWTVTFRLPSEIRSRLASQRDYNLLAASGLFDGDWYLAQYSDVRLYHTDPLVHYLQHGAAEGRDPNPLFDSDWYLEHNRDVAAAGTNPLVHYVRHGAEEGRDPNPLFDTDWYLERYRDVAAAGLNPLLHYLQHGAPEHRDPSPLFNTEWYLSQNPDVVEAAINPLAHYLCCGSTEGRRLGWDLSAIDSEGELSILYQEWIRRFDELTPDDLARIRRSVDSGELPAISLLAVFDDPGQVGEFTAQLEKQLYAPSQIVYCFTENCSPEVVAGLAADLQSDARYTLLRAGSDQRVCLPPDCGLLVICDGGNVLRQHALFVLADALRGRAAGMAYPDQDRISPSGRRIDPFFKPDFSPELAARTNYLGSLAVLSIEGRDITATVRQLLADRTAAAAVTQAAIRCAPGNVVHIPFVLYSTRDRIDLVGKAPSPRPPAGRPASVSIIIPTRDGLDLLRPCIASIRQKSSYPMQQVEIIVLDNGSSDRATLLYLKSISDSGEAVVIRHPGEFNYSELNNLGAARASGEILIFLNNDTLVDAPDWLSILASYAMQEGVGAVGAKLLYPDRTVQHGGVVVGVQGVAAHAFVGLNEHEPGYHGLACLDHEVTAVTGACLAIRKTAFERIGGFDTNLRVAFGDTVLCLRALLHGYSNMYVGGALLVHLESKSRGLDDTPSKRALFRTEANYARSLHDDLFRNDPFYSPNLSLELPYHLAFPPRRRKLWRAFARSPRRIRVLMLSVTHEIGHGVAVVVDIMSRYLAGKNFDVFVGGPRGRNEFGYDGCQRVRLHDGREAAIFAVENDIDCIVAHTPPFFSVTRWTGDWPRTIIYDYGEPNPEFFPDEAARREVLAEKRFVSAMAHRLFAISAAVQAASGIDRMAVIRLANSHLAIWGDEPAQRRVRARAARGWIDRTIVLNVCRFHEAERRYKGIDLYVSIMSQFLRTHPDLAARVIFVICGKASDADIAFARGCGLEVAANVTDDEMIDLFAAADIYVNMSRWEGYNLGIAQALAMGLPVIASDIPAHREFEIPVSNEPRLIVAKLLELVGEARSGRLLASREAQVVSWEGPLSRFAQEISDLCEG